VVSVVVTMTITENAITPFQLLQFRQENPFLFAGSAAGNRHMWLK